MFDATQYVTQNTNSAPMDRSPIPEGKYVARMTNFERKQTQKGGQMLNVEFTVDVGSTARKCWNNFNLVHESAKTVQYAYEALARFCVACGYDNISDEWNPVELMGKDIEIYIKINANGYNDIKGFYKKEMTPVEQGQAVYGQQPQTQQPATPSPAPAPTGVKPDDEIPF